MANPLDANITAEPRHPAEPDRDDRGSRIRDALVTFRFAELLTRPPIPRHIQSLSWGDGFVVRPSPGSTGDCSLPTAPGSPPPPHDRSPWVQALAAPASAPFPRPLGFPDRVVEIPAGSEPWQSRRLPRARSPWESPTAPWSFPRGPSLGRSSDCPVPRAPGFPDRVVIGPAGCKPSRFHRLGHVGTRWPSSADPWSCPQGPRTHRSSASAMPKLAAVASLMPPGPVSFRPAPQQRRRQACCRGGISSSYCACASAPDKCRSCACSTPIDC